MGIRAVFRALWQQKASAAGALIAFGQAGKPQWTPRKYDKLAEEGYQKNVIAYRCIGEIARGAATVPFVLMAGEREIEAHPVLDLLARPNPMQGRFEFLEAVFAYRQIAGNSYVEAVPVNGSVAELWPKRPDRMKVVPAEDGTVAGYVLETKGRRVTWPVDPRTGQADILHLKKFHPLSDWYGLSPIEAAAFAIDQHNEAGAWNKSLLQRGARPSGALVYAPKGDHASDALTDEQREALKEQLDDFQSGGDNAGRPLLLEGGLDWKEMSLSPKDMDWLKGKDATERDIANAFGCPPQILSLPGDSTFSNMREARLWMWEQTIIPEVEAVVTELNRWLLPRFGDNLELVPDFDEILAMAPRRERVWDKVQTSDFLTINEKRAATGYEEIENGDVVLVPATMIPLGADLGQEPEGEPEDEEAGKLFRLAYGDPEEPIPDRQAS